jgi:hypothetical protein
LSTTDPAFEKMFGDGHAMRISRTALPLAYTEEVTDTIDPTSSETAGGGSAGESPSLAQLAVQLMDRARDGGVSLVGRAACWPG